MTMPSQTVLPEVSSVHEYSFFEPNASDPDLKTFWGRFQHFQRVVDPKNFLATQQSIDQSVQLIAKYKQQELDSHQKLQLSASELKAIERALNLKNSAILADSGEQIPRMMRMCAFVPMNIPILFGMLMAKPTVINTIFWQWFNQSFNAGLNYGNRNPSSTYTNKDLAVGYFAAVSSSIGVALLLRKMFSGVSSRMSGSKLILINSFVSAVASGSANFMNTFSMRYKEVENGINVYADENLTQKVGISKVSAKKAVVETALSRVCLSFGCLMSPAVVFYMFERMGKYPQSRALKVPFEISVFLFGVMVSLPLSIAIFPNTGSSTTNQIEEQLRKEYTDLGHKGAFVYYNKGL